MPKFDVTAACLKYAKDNESHGGRAFDIVLSEDVSLGDVMWSADRWEDGVPVTKMFGRNEELDLELEAGTRLRGVTYRSYDDYPGKWMTDFYLNGLWYSARFTTPESLANGTYEALDGCGETIGDE